MGSPCKALSDRDPLHAHRLLLSSHTAQAARTFTLTDLASTTFDVIFDTISFLWFSIKRISSNSQQFVHILQVCKICHGDIRHLTQTDLLPFSCLVRQLPSRYQPLSLPDKSLTYRKPDYPNTAGAEDAIELQKNMEDQHP